MEKSSLILLFLALTFFACEKANLNAGEASLEGTWNVNSIFSAYGERTELGINVEESIQEEGNLGAFNFSETTVDASYTRLDTLYKIASSWELKRDKISEGFFKVEQYTLCTDDQSFICEFGDQTKDAERNATQIRLIFETTEIGAYEQFVLKLEKE
ncbi:MAG: hypothetical protein AAF806_24225 [Bacteroidota bacterium]